MAALCKSCIHQKVCMKDKNLVGDVFVPGNPMIFDNAKLFAQYEERKKAGFPCDDYTSADVAPVRHGRWGDKNECSECGCQPWFERDIHTLNYCPNCGAHMGETEFDPRQTNYDLLIRKTPEQLAHFMTPADYKFPCPPNFHDCQYDIIPCWICWLRWLKAPAEVDDGT